MTDRNSTIAQERLAAWMVKAKVTQVSLAQSIGITQAAVSRWISGQCRPSYKHMVKLETISGRFVSVYDWNAPDVAERGVA